MGEYGGREPGGGEENVMCGGKGMGRKGVEEMRTVEE